MAFMLKIHAEIKGSKVSEFKTNQEALCKVMLEHPGVICYHVEYPSEGVSEWVEIYANDETFRAHLVNKKAKEPFGALVDACNTITFRCFGDPDEASRKILKGFGTTYEEIAPGAFVLNPKADKDSSV